MKYIYPLLSMIVIYGLTGHSTAANPAATAAARPGAPLGPVLVSSSAASALTATVGKVTLDTTGANFVILAIGTGSSTHVITDSVASPPCASPCNIWLPLKQYISASGVAIQLFYATNPHVGSGHEIVDTSPNLASYSCLAAESFSGVAATSPLDASTQNGGVSYSPPYQAGSITPAAGSLVITAMTPQFGGSEVYGLPSGYTITSQLPFKSGANYGCGLAYSISDGTTANPGWTNTVRETGAATVAAFLPLQKTQPPLQTTVQLNVKTYQTSPTQAVIAYTAPDSTPCAVEVSESSTYAPLVNDVNGILFPGSQLDSRSTALTAGNSRIFVVGTRLIQTGSDGTNYSRALQQNTLHYVRITCSGSNVATGTFTTKTLPMGATYSDLIPLAADGSYLFPGVTGKRNERLIDPQTGVLLTRINEAGDNSYNSAPVATAGGFGEYCNAAIDAYGNYLCMFNDYPQGIYPNLYAINPVTGASKFLGAAYFFRAEIDPIGASVQGVSGGGERVMWDQASTNIAYVGVTILSTGRSTIAKWTYSGNDDPALNVSGSPQQSPHTVVDLLGGADLTALAHAFNSALDTSKFSCGVTGLQSHYFLLRCTGIGGVIQNVYAWEGAYDMGNGQPLGSGGTGHMAALAQEWALPGTRWCGDHSYEYVGNVPVYSFALHSLTGLSSAPFDHGGPYSSVLNGSIGPSDTTISIDSTYPGGAPPSGYSRGEPVSPHPDYFLQKALPGDNFSIDGEVMRIVAKASPTSWTVARGAGGTNAASHNSGSAVLMQCQNVNNPGTISGGYLWWDFVDSPDGTKPTDWVINFGDHPVSRGNYRVDSGYPFRTGAVTDKTAWGALPKLSVTAHPLFSGQSAPGDGNSYQKHVSMPSGAATTFFDQTYFVGTSLFSAQNASATTPITGSLYQYHYDTGAAYGNGTALTPKYFPTLTKTAGHAFVDVSGPGAVLTGQPGDQYKYCIANAANECNKGSARGDIFFNHPALSSADPWCTGGENGIGASDICIGNFAANGLASIQFGIPGAASANATSDPTGTLSYRPLTRLFETYDGNLGPNLKLTFGGEIAILFQYTSQKIPNVATAVWAIHVPPIPPSDGINRGTFVPATLSLTAPSSVGVATARVKFWYTEQGGTASTPYCTSRREACIATASAIDPANPFSYGVTESYDPTPCAASCFITVPVYPLHTAYYIVEFLNSAGAVVATKSGVAMENTSVSVN